MNNVRDYLNLNLSYRDFYIKNNNEINKSKVSIEDLFYFVSEDADILLPLVGVASKNCGYKYWKDAIFIMLISDKNDISICKDIYPAIAKKYNKTAAAIERAMRLSLEPAMYYVSKSEDNVVGEYLKDSLLNPHNKEILIKLTELISSVKFHELKNKFIK